MMRPIAGLPPGIWLPAMLMMVAAPIALGCLRHWLFDQYCALFLLQIIIYCMAAWCLLRPNADASTYGRRALIAILVVAALLRLVALCAPVFLSSDAYRYVWDGRVQAAGINPYRYIPADPKLSFLRDTTIYPNINRADYAHTIYPPTAQIGFYVFEHISDSLMGMKLGMLACDGLSIGCLIALLRERGLPAARVLLYAWHPLPIWEFAGMGHVDAIAVALLMLSFLLAARRAPVWTGIALGAATLVKYYPIIAAPALYRRWDWRMPCAAIATMLLLYLPYMGAGAAVVGFMPGYVNEEGLRSGNGLFLWALLQRAVQLPAEGIRYYLPFAAIVMGALAAWVQFGRSRVSQDVSGVLGTYVLASAFVLLFSPHNAWYFAWLVPFLCFRFSIAHLWLTGACVLIYTYPNPFGLDLHLLLYLPFIVLLIMQYGLARHLTERIDAEPVNRPSG